MIRQSASLAVFAIAVLGGNQAAFADPLPKTGKISVHSAFRSYGDDAAQLSPTRMTLSGMFNGVLFNDKGSGPFHEGWVVCSYQGDLDNGAGGFVGSCAWTDADGDKAFADYTGKFLSTGGSEGVNRLKGGTGKFTGIDAAGPFRCKFVAPGLYSCKQEFDYKLP